MPDPTATPDPATLLAQLVAIDSVNPALAAGGAGEGAAADFCTEWLAARGFEIHRLEARPGRPSLVAIARGTGGGRSLMLNGHLDTVGVAGYDGDPLAPEVREGKLFGRGAYDMKCGVAAMMAAAVRARDHARVAGPLRGDIVLALVADEEHASFGTEEVVAALDVVAAFRADAAIVCEPTNLDIVPAHKGFAWFDIEVEGLAAHGSRPDLGIDAIAKAGHFLVALEAYAAALAAGTRHPLLGTGSVHASLISGGKEASTYPAHCRITLERRTIPGETAETVAAELTAILDGLAASVPGFRARVVPGLVRGSFQADPGWEIVRALIRHAEAALGHPPVIRGEPFWTDAQILDAAGIPSLLFGPSGGGAHAETEWADLASLETATEILAGVIGEFCS